MKNFKIGFLLILSIPIITALSSCNSASYFSCHKIAEDIELKYFTENDKDIEFNEIVTSIDIGNNKKIIITKETEYKIYEYDFSNHSSKKLLELPIEETFHKLYTNNGFYKNTEFQEFYKYGILFSNNYDKLLNAFVKNNNLELYWVKELDDNVLLFNTVYNLKEHKLVKDELLFTTINESDINLKKVFEIENSTKTYTKNAHYKFANIYSDADYRKFIDHLIFDKDNNLVLIPVLTFFDKKEFSYLFRQYDKNMNTFIDFNQYLTNDDGLLFNKIPVLDNNNNTLYGSYIDSNDVIYQNLFISNNGITKKYILNLPNNISGNTDAEPTTKFKEIPKRTIIQDSKDKLFIISAFANEGLNLGTGYEYKLNDLNIKIFNKNLNKVVSDKNYTFNDEMFKKYNLTEDIDINFFDSYLDDSGNLFLVIDNSKQSFKQTKDLSSPPFVNSTVYEYIYGQNSFWVIKLNSEMQINWINMIENRLGIASQLSNSTFILFIMHHDFFSPIIKWIMINLQSNMLGKM